MYYISELESPKIEEKIQKGICSQISKRY